MRYTTEKIYQLVGREDKTANVEFFIDSESYHKYGGNITVVFLYTQKEREELDELLKKGDSCSSGYIKAKYFGHRLNDDLIKGLFEQGINSDDISHLMYFRFPTFNTFHSNDKRKISKINIPITPLPNGGDLDWIYKFRKMQKEEGVAFSPEEELYYLAAKYYYEPNQLTATELLKILDKHGNLLPEFKWHYFGIKVERNEISESEKIELSYLLQTRKRNRKEKLNKSLIDAGSSFKKLVKKNPDKALELYRKVLFFRERRLNSKGEIPIYIDLDSYLHIYTRHVKEMLVSDHFEHKDKFQWDEQDVLIVIKKVIEEINTEIQFFFQNNQKSVFHRYGDQSIYFEGDYYTLHIDPSGRIITFHKNRKKHE